MPEQASASQRSIHRLAEGVQRSRLIEPILSARPPLVVVSAPSGYGKTVLAAQVAAAGDFAEVVWIRNTGEAGSIRDALELIAETLVGSSLGPDALALEELCHICSGELSAVPDEHSMLVVMDNASWAGDADSCRILEEIFSEAPSGTTAMVTTRVELPTTYGSTRVWTVAASQLMLTDSEIVETWFRHSGRTLAERQTKEVAQSSGRHAALVSLMARHAAMVDADVTHIERTSSVSSLLKSLVSDQLGSDDCSLLDYAAVLGEGTVDSLADCCLGSDTMAGMSRIAAAIPLVSVNADGVRRFTVHALVSEVCDSVARLGDRDPTGLGRVIEALAADGATARALEVAIEFGAPEIVADGVRRFAARLLKGASWELVRAGLDSIPAEVVALDPTLLLARAELAWVQGDKADAIRQATLAIRLAEISEGCIVPSAARSLLAGMRMSVADYAGAISDVESLLCADNLQNADDLADALYAAIPAYGLLGDTEGLRRSTSAVRRVVASGAVAGPRLARLEMVIGVVTDVVLGDSLEAADLLYSAASRADVPLHWRAMTLCNCAASSVEMGDLDRARSACAEATLAGSSFSTSVDQGLLSAISASADVIEQGGTGHHSSTEALICLCEAGGEALTLATTCSIGSQCSVMAGDMEYAHRLGQRGIRASAETGSPVLLWLAELVHAQTSLALGDVEHARLTAERILAQADSLGLMRHVLHCRMLLAECARRGGDLAAAVEHLYAVSDYIVGKSPALTVVSYLRAFPAMLGPLALAMGVDRIPARMLNLMPGAYGKEALEQAGAVLTPAETRRLAARMRTEAQKAAERDAAAGLSDAVCQVRVLGRLEVIAPHGPVADRDWCKRKARLLFAMLVARAGTDVPRGEIIEYLWPEMDEERALNNFYVVWSAMKRALAPNSVREMPCPFVEHVHGVCRIVPGRVVTDLDEFEAHLYAARKARASGDADAELAAIRAAEQVYRGDVLPGDIYDDWFAPVRSRCRHEFEDAMLRAAQILEERGAPHEGLSMLRRPMTHDVLREDFYQAALRLQIAAGQRSAAIETYMSCRSRLVEDLGIDPSRETTALYEQVLGMEDAPV